MLRSQWNESMTFLSLVELCARLDGAFQHHRPAVGPSLPPVSRCPKCGKIVKEGSGLYRISVRAAILALGRFRIASPGLTKKLEKEWAIYRKQNQLDLYGCRAEAAQTAGDERSRLGCAHSVPH